MSLPPREFRVGYRAARIEKLVLIAIARAAHLTNRECSPSVQMLAFRCGMSESAVRAIKRSGSGRPSRR